MTPTTRRPAAGALVLGCGNPIMGDDGLGLVALEQLGREWDLPPSVTLVDGGTWGMNLLPLIEDAAQLLLLDAIRGGQAPGTLIEIERADLPRYFSLKISPHQIDLREVLGLAELRGTLPAQAVAIGAEPEFVDLATGLTPAVAARVDDVVLRAVDRLAHWGYCPARRDALVHA